MEGSYYVGVYGWCTPDDQVINWETDGPCSYAAKTLFNVTVQLTFCKLNPSFFVVLLPFQLLRLYFCMVNCIFFLCAIR